MLVHSASIILSMPNLIVPHLFSFDLLYYSPVLSMAAGEWQLIETNPLSKVKKFRESQGRVRFLSEQERDSFLAIRACSIQINT
jgi:hypothetical protein